MAATRRGPAARTDNNKETWEIAVRLVSQFGDGAPECASKWGLALLETGDIEGCINWISVMTLCKVLLSRYEALEPMQGA